MSKEPVVTAWVVGVRLALLAMILNVAAFLLPDHGRLALAAPGSSTENAASDSAMPAAALRRAGLTAEQAQGLHIPCFVSSPRQGGSAVDGAIPGPHPMTAAGHACDICITVAAHALAASTVSIATRLDFVAFQRGVPVTQALVAFAGYAPASRDPPRRVA